MEGAVTVAREVTPHGEVALRRRGEVLELVVDGAFAMDTVDTSTERLLASVESKLDTLVAAKKK